MVLRRTPHLCKYRIGNLWHKSKGGKHQTFRTSVWYSQRDEILGILVTWSCCLSASAYTTMYHVAPRLKDVQPFVGFNIPDDAMFFRGPWPYRFLCLLTWYCTYRIMLRGFSWFIFNGVKWFPTPVANAFRAIGFNPFHKGHGYAGTRIK